MQSFHVYFVLTKTNRWQNGRFSSDLERRHSSCAVIVVVPVDFTHSPLRIHCSSYHHTVVENMGKNLAWNYDHLLS